MKRRVVRRQNRGLKRHLRRYAKRDETRAEAVAKEVKRQTAKLEREIEDSKRTAAFFADALQKARTFEDWGVIDRIRFLFAPKSVLGKRGRDAA
jgi:transposase